MLKNQQPVRPSDLYAASIRVILRGQALTGAYIASPNFSVYNYSWFRDGSFIANAMSIAGEKESARRFHSWATNVILERERKIVTLVERSRRDEKIELSEHLDCRYTLDGKEGLEPWTNFQLDGFGTWIWSLSEFAEMGGVISDETKRAVHILVRYLIQFWAEDSYDWWEESFGHQHVSTLGSIGAGLQRYSNFVWADFDLAKQARESTSKIKELIHDRGTKHGRLVKWIDGDGLDASLSALFSPFNFFEGKSSIAQQTISMISSQLGILGTHRHVEDSYFGGAPWPLLSCFLGLNLVDLGDTETANEIIHWVSTTANADLELPEQIDADLLHPEGRPGWIANWGEPAIPLLWSHAMFIHLYDKLIKVGVQL